MKGKRITGNGVEGPGRSIPMLSNRNLAFDNSGSNRGLQEERVMIVSMSLQRDVIFSIQVVNMSSCWAISTSCTSEGGFADDVHVGPAI